MVPQLARLQWLSITFNMQLLTKNEIKKAKTDRDTQDALLAVKTQKFIKYQTGKLNEFKQHKEKALNSIEEKYTQKINGLFEKKKVLENEVGLLEIEKKNALKPVQEEKEYVERLHLRVQKDTENLEQKAKDLDKKEIILSSLKTQLEHTENTLAKRHNDLDIFSSTLNDQKNALAQDQEALSIAQHEHEKSILRQYKTLESTKNELTIREESLKKREEMYQKDIQELDKKRKWLTDREQMLKRGFEELKRKKYGSKKR